MKEITISSQEENQRLDKFLMKYMNTAPKGFVYKMLRKKRIRYNGKKAQGNEILQDGDVLWLYLAEETIESFMEEKTLFEAERHFGIVYEDDDILAVAKPAGLLSHPEKSSDKDSLIQQVLYYLYQKQQFDPSKEASFTPALCNRLDRNTSGIVLVGKTLAALQAANETIASRKADKFYLTLVKGEIKEAGEISGFLSKQEGKNQSRVVQEQFEGSKTACTRYRPMFYKDGYTLLEIQLVTGRSHQIRAHMQAMGHPIVGDRKYGDERVNQKFKVEYGLSNQFLHASRIVWKNTDGVLAYLSRQELIAPLPKQLREICFHLFEAEI